MLQELSLSRKFDIISMAEAFGAHSDWEKRALSLQDSVSFKRTRERKILAQNRRGSGCWSELSVVQLHQRFGCVRFGLYCSRWTISAKRSKAVIIFLLLLLLPLVLYWLKWLHLMLMSRGEGERPVREVVDTSGSTLKLQFNGYLSSLSVEGGRSQFVPSVWLCVCVCVFASDGGKK